MYPAGTIVVFKLNTDPKYDTHTKGNGFFNESLKPGDKAKIIDKNHLEIISGDVAGRGQFWNHEEQFKRNWVRYGNILNK